MSEEAQNTAPASQPEAAPAQAPQQSGQEAKALVAQWLQEHYRSVSYTLKSPAWVIEQWEAYKAERAEKDMIPLLGGFSQRLGYTDDDGLKVLEQRGRQWSRVVKLIRSEVVEIIAGRMMTGRSNQVGCIFWLKNCAGWRDRTPEEAKEERDDWLARLQVARTEAAAADRADAPPDSGPSLQLPGSDDLTADADFDPPGATPAITAKSA